MKIRTSQMSEPPLTKIKPWWAGSCHGPWSVVCSTWPTRTIFSRPLHPIGLSVIWATDPRSGLAEHKLILCPHWLSKPWPRRSTKRSMKADLLLVEKFRGQTVIGAHWIRLASLHFTAARAPAVTRQYFTRVSRLNRSFQKVFLQQYTRMFILQKINLSHFILCAIKTWTKMLFTPSSYHIHFRGLNK